MHPSSVNHTKRDPNEKQVAFGEKQLYAFTEKRQNLSASAPGASASTLLVTTTRLDPMTYVLFGAYEIAVGYRSLETSMG
jgi:small subunit ribosomal protein S24e